MSQCRMPNGARRQEDPEPRYEQWRKVDEWTLLQATCLLLDVEPDQNRSKLGRFIGEHWYGETIPIEGHVAWAPSWAVTVLQHVRDARNVACVSAELPFTTRPANQAYWQTPARAFLIWARDKGYSFSSAFDSLLAGVSTRAELEQEIEKFRAEVAASAPLPSGNRKTLDKLGAYFARKFQFDPAIRKGDRTQATTACIKALKQHNVTIDDSTIRSLMEAGSKRYPPDDEAK